MHLLLTSVTAIVVSAVTLQLVFLAIQVAGSLQLGGNAGENVAHRARCAVVIPAHNERGNIAQAIAAIRPQLNPADRLIVVADNCSDDTAQMAAAAGADTIERTDTVRIGKGYALDFAMRHIESTGIPDVIIFVDADCIAAPGCISLLANMVEARGRPVQGKYLMRALLKTPAARMAEFSFKIKNYVRPGGGSRFGLPCLLYGSAMAFPWKLIGGSILATGHLTEDLKLAIDLSLHGFPPLYCPEAQCDSTFPESEGAMTTQRTRWQHGYFASLVEYTPKLIAAALRRADWRPLAVAVDLSVPPLALMFMITALMSLLASAAILLGAGGVLAETSLVLFPAFVLLILIIWRFHGRDIVSGADLVASLNQLVARISMLWNFITKPQRSWVRTERKEDR